MMITKPPRLAALMLILAGCSTSPPAPDVQITATKSVQPLSEPPSGDPWQQTALALKALPKGYHQQSELSTMSTEGQQRFAQGVDLLTQNKLAEAHKLFVNLAEQSPQISAIWLQLAQLQGKTVKSSDIASEQQTALDLQTRYLKNAISTHPDNYIAHNQLAVLLRRQGLFNEALNHYDMALKSWPAFAEARLNRAILYDLYLGNKPAALEDYQVYQALVSQPVRQLKGWIADLQRQIHSQQQQFNATSGSIKGEIQ